MSNYLPTLPSIIKTLLPLIFVLSVLFVLSSPGEAYAANLYWVGADGANTSVASNWKTTDPAGCGSGDAGAAPGSSDVAIFDPDCDNGAAVTGTFSVQGVSMVSGYTGTLAQGAVSMTIGSSGWTQAGGTFTGNSDGNTANITMSSDGSFSLTGGTFTSTNDTLNHSCSAACSWTINGGALAANSGTVSFADGSFAATTTITGSATYNNLTFSDTGNVFPSLTIASGTTLTTSGTLTLSNSGNDGINTLTGSGTIAAQGNITAVGSGYVGDLVIVINGSGTQTITGESDTNTFIPALTINKSSGTLNFVSGIGVDGAWINQNAGATLDFGTSTILLGCGYNCAYNSSTSITGSTSFYNLTFIDFYNLFPTRTVSSGTTLTVTHTLTLSEAGGGVDTLNGPGAIFVQGDFTTSGSAAPNYWTGNVAITLSGSGAQTITHNAGGFPTGTFTINKSSGTATLATNFNLAGSGQDLLISNGTLDLSTFTLTVNDVTTISGGGILKTVATGDLVVGGGGVNNAGQVNLGLLTTCGAADGITITSTSGGSARTWTGNGRYSFYDVAITDMTDQKGAITAWSSTNNGNNTGVHFQSGCPIPSMVNLKFDEGNGTSANDSSGNSNTGTLAGSTIPTWQQENLCVFGKCLYFDGSSSKVTVAATTTGVQSVGFWVRPASVTTAGLIDLDGGTHKISVSSGTISATGFTTPTIYVNARVSSTLVANQWQYVEVTTGTSFSASAIKIGFDNTNYTQGFFDEFRIYNYARNSGQVAIDYNLGYAQILAASNNQPSALSNGLVGYWKMDESAADSCTGGTNDNCDSSGNANNAAWSGDVTAATGKFGNSTTYDGSGDYSTASSTSSLQVGGGDLTVATWFNVTSPNGCDTLLSKGPGGGAEYRIIINCVSNIFISAGGSGANIGHANYSTGTWTHIALVRKGTTGIIYENGVQIGSVTLSGTSTNASSLYFGAEENPTNFFNGKLDETRVYNRALSAADISVLYNFAPGPVGYWKMDEGSGTTAADSSGNGQVGNLTNNATWGTGKYGKGGVFDGTDDYVSVTNTTALQVVRGDFTYSFWQNATSFPNCDDPFGKFNSSAANYEITISYNCASLINITVSGVAANFGGNSSLVANQWQHITFTRSGSTTSLYMDGVLKATSTSLTGTTVGTGALTFGGSDHAATDFLGKIDDFKVYNYARTQAQIIEDMNAGHPAPGSPVGTPLGHWRFDEGADNTCTGGTNDACNTGSQGSLLDAAQTGMAVPATATTGWTQSGKFGKALIFDNADDVINAGSDASVDDLTGSGKSMTLSAWIYPNTVGEGSAGVIMGKNVGTTPSAGWIWQLVATNTMKFSIDGTTDLVVTASNSKVTMSAWNHVALTYDGSGTATNVHMYINGVETTYQTQTNLATIVSDATSSLRIGNDSTGANTFDGTIDEVKVYNQALTADQIKEDMNQGKSQVLGAAGNNSSYQANSANQEYCVPGDSTSCAAPVGRWDFKEGSGSTVNDISGNANTGTWNGTLGSQWANASGKISGKAGVFNGSDSYVNIPSASSLNLTSAFTLETWIKLTNTSQSSKWVSGKYDAGTSYGIIYGYTSGKFEFYSDLYTGSDPRTAFNSTISDTNWHHVAITYDGTTLKGYLDGIVDVSSTKTFALTPNAGAITLGQSGLGNFVAASLNQYRIFNYNRTGAQIAWDYNKGAPLAWWNIDECQGTNIKEIASNTYTGTLTIGASGEDTVGNCTTASTAWGSGVSGKRNYSVDLDGTDDYIQAADSANLRFDGATADFSLFAWVKRGANGVMEVINKEDADDDGYRLQFTAGNVVRCSVDGIDIDSTTTITDTNWHHIGCTIDRDGNGQVYIDGQANGTATAISSEVMANTANLRLGARAYTIANYLDGQIDDVRIYNYALTLTQIRNVMNDGAAYRVGPSTGAP